MKTYLIPTTAQVAVQLNQQLLDVSPVSSPNSVAGGGEAPGDAVVG